MEAVTEEQRQAAEPGDTPAEVAAASPRSPEGDGAAQTLADEHTDRGERAVEAYARGHEGLTEDDERDALDFLLAPKPPRLYDVKVSYDTAAGERELTFVVSGMDGRQLDKIEQAHVSEATGRLDRISADCHLVAESTRFLAGRAGHTVELSSREFLTIRRPNPADPDAPAEEHVLASPADALEARFKTQLGLLSGVASEIRRVSGYDPERVGTAKRRLVNAVGNS